MKKILSIIFLLALPLSSNAEELFIYNWSDYIAEDTIANFEAETGIDVTYDVFDSNEVLEAKLLAGGSGYDLVVPSGSFMENQIKAGVFQKLDKSKLPNLSNLDPSVLEKTDAHDPGGEYSVNYMYGTTGIGYNVAAVEERGGDVESWDIIFNPDEISKYADCGVAMLDAPSEVVEIAISTTSLGASSMATPQSAYLEISSGLKIISHDSTSPPLSSTAATLYPIPVVPYI